MLCQDIHKAIAPWLDRYQQIYVVVDEAVNVDWAYPTLRITVSEQDKSLETVSRIWDFLLEQHFTRRGLLIAVGGGVLTDLAGFAAATYKRGIDYLNIPTTLLAMVDASTGGKTGFNYHGLKNAIGAFHAPVETLIYPPFLDTLPSREFLSGFAEMLKTGLIASSPSERGSEGALWYRLLQYDLDTIDTAALAPLIMDCIAVKERIVAADPDEQGPRKALNLGHTFGHALEEINLSPVSPKGRSPLSLASEGLRPIGCPVDIHRTSWGEVLPHGYAVLYGLIAELYLSVTLLGCPHEPLQQLTLLMLRYYGRPVCKCSDRRQLITLMQQDKKNEHAAEINCTLLHAIGAPAINQTVTPAQAGEALEYLFSL